MESLASSPYTEEFYAILMFCLFGTMVNVSCCGRKMLKFQFLLSNDVFHNIWGRPWDLFILASLKELKTEEALVLHFG